MVQLTLPHEALGGLTPHEVERGFPLALPWHWERRTQDWGKMPAAERLNREEAQAVGQKVRQYIEAARTALGRTQARMTAQANKHRREPDFGPGDYVVILRKPEITDVSDRPSRKLDFKASPPYKILRTEGSSYVLNMPPEFQGKNLFHADVLRKWPNNPLPGQGTANPRPVEVEGSDEKEYELEEVLTSRTHYRKLQYQVRWKD